MFKWIGKFLLTLVLSLLLLLVILSCIQHFQSQRYVFAPPQAFSGSYLYNPYQGMDTVWRQCNFHAHAHAWGGLTDGKAQNGSALLAKYDSMGYDLACISDYHRINPEQDTAATIFVPVYEHGHNLFKAHRLAMGSSRVSYYDVSLLHSLHDRQYIINRVHTTSPVVAVAHPKFGGGHTLSDFGYLSGYELMEVLNHYRLSDKYWDVALSAGKAVWIVGNDDCHDIRKADETGTNWTMVAANTPQGDTVLAHLRDGQAYGVVGKNGVNENYVQSVTADSLTINIKLSKKAREIRLVGQHGLLRAAMTNNDHISYTFAPEDTYIRAEVKMRNSKMYLNPIVRYNGTDTPTNLPTAQFSWWQTWLMRLLVLNLLAFSLLAYRQWWRYCWA